MIKFSEIIAEAINNIRAHKLRSVLTMFGIAWGIASVVFMISIGEGLKLGYRHQLKALGTDIAVIWSGRTSNQAGDQRAGKNIWLDYNDVTAIEAECYLVKHTAPEMVRRLESKSDYNAGVFMIDGIAPIYQEIRSMELSEGRHLNDSDFLEARTVCIIGDEVRKQLFGERRAVGEQIQIRAVTFTVIGELEHKDQNTFNAYNGLDDTKLLIPYTTMSKYYPDPRPFLTNSYVGNIVIVPVSPEMHEEALWQVKRLLGRRHGFEPGDEGALLVYDSVENARLVISIFETMQMFLGFIAVVTLSLGGVGVMNIMLVSVAERTREIGLKKAIGATRRRILVDFFIESLALTLSSGITGLIFAWFICSMVNQMPLPSIFAGLPLTPSTAFIAFLTLSAIGLFAGIYPARRASMLTPVEALRYE